jgi:hypothetical protein
MTTTTFTIRQFHAANAVRFRSYTRLSQPVVIHLLSDQFSGYYTHPVGNRSFFCCKSVPGKACLKCDPDSSHWLGQPQLRYFAAALERRGGRGTRSKFHTWNPVIVSMKPSQLLQQFACGDTPKIRGLLWRLSGKSQSMKVEYLGNFPPPHDMNFNIIPFLSKRFGLVQQLDYAKCDGVPESFPCDSLE